MILGRESRKILWTVQEGTASQPAFTLVLAGYGDAWSAVALGRGMGDGVTLIALQPPDEDATRGKPGTAHDLATKYVAALRERVPKGPYHLGGYSAGALLALEVARQLRAQGEEVDLLVMLDPLFVHYTDFEQFCWFVFEQFVATLAPVLGGWRQFKILTAMTQDEGLQRHLRVLANHVPEPYDGRVTLIEASGSQYLRPPTYIGDWTRVARGGLDRRKPGGTHHSFMRPPHVTVLGQQLVGWMTDPAKGRA
jgi:thioesterase domain-containing protein